MAICNVVSFTRGDFSQKTLLSRTIGTPFENILLKLANFTCTNVLSEKKSEKSEHFEIPKTHKSLRKEVFR